VIDLGPEGGADAAKLGRRRRKGPPSDRPPAPLPASPGTCRARRSAGQVQRADPANGTEAKQFVDAVNGSSSRQHLNSYAARGQLLLKADCGPHATVGARSDDKPLRVAVQQRAKVL
jgi:hypothetical protein